MTPAASAGDDPGNGSEGCTEKTSGRKSRAAEKTGRGCQHGMTEKTDGSALQITRMMTPFARKRRTGLFSVRQRCLLQGTMCQALSSLS